MGNDSSRRVVVFNYKYTYRKVNRNLLALCSILSDDFNYLDFKCIKDSLKFDKTKTPCQTMMNNLMAAMQTKLHQVFLDSRINSIRTVEINIQESFTYFARRLDAFVSELPPGKQKEYRFSLLFVDDLF